MPFSHSAIGYLVADLQKRVHAALDKLPENYWVYLLSPIYSLFSFKTLVVVTIWMTLSCKERPTAGMCHNIPFALYELNTVPQANPPRRFSSMPPESSSTFKTPTRLRSFTQSGSWQSSWNSYTSGLSGGFSRNIASSSKATLGDTSYVANASMRSVEGLFDGNPSSSCILTLASPCRMRVSSTTRSFRDDHLGATPVASQFVVPEQKVEAPSGSQIVCNTCTASSSDDFTIAASDVPARPLLADTSIIEPTASSSDQSVAELLAIPVQSETAEAPETLSVSRIITEADRSQLLDESLDDLVVPPTPTPCSSSVRQSASLVLSGSPALVLLGPPAQSAATPAPTPDEIQITVTAPENEETPPAKHGSVRPAIRIARDQLLSANAAAPPSIITPGRGRGPSFIPLLPTPTVDVKRKAPLADSTNTSNIAAAQTQTDAPPKVQKEKHWRKKKRVSAAKPAPTAANPPVHSEDKPNWAAAPGSASEVPLIQRIQPLGTPVAAQKTQPQTQPQNVSTPKPTSPMKRPQSQSTLASQPLIKRIKADTDASPREGLSLIERLQASATADVQTKPKPPAQAKAVKIALDSTGASGSSSTPKPTAKPAAKASDVPNWATEAAAVSRAPRGSTGANPKKGKHRIHHDEAGRWKRGTWATGRFASRTRTSRKDDE
ncbi:hypothetical protein EIP86_003577 [Pleurotus ostreatoroseus]|nr:hypothetical protein EIP86_003577 [Pleurotus ostreatoroseus]